MEFAFAGAESCVGDDLNVESRNAPEHSQKAAFGPDIRSIDADDFHG